MPRSAPLNPVIVAERLIPGFCGDLSSWTFWLDADGKGIQEVYFTHPENPDRGEPLIYTCQIPPAEVAATLAAAEAGGFGGFASHYSVGDALDVETNALSLPICGELKRVEAFGPEMMVYDGSAEIKIYCELWDRIAQLRPYGRE